MVLYTIILGLIPCTWISVIWDQIIDPEFDLEHIEQPENRIIKMFYTVSGKINTSVFIRNVVFVVIGVMTMLSSVLDLIVWPPCMLENPRVILTLSILKVYPNVPFDVTLYRTTRTDAPWPSWSTSPSSGRRTPSSGSWRPSPSSSTSSSSSGSLASKPRCRTPGHSSR